MSLQTMLATLAPPIGACTRALPRNESPSMPPLASAEPPVTLQSELSEPWCPSSPWSGVVARLGGGGERRGDHETGGDADGDDAHLLQHENSCGCRGSERTTGAGRASGGSTSAGRARNVAVRDRHDRVTTVGGRTDPGHTRARPPIGWPGSRDVERARQASPSSSRTTGSSALSTLTATLLPLRLSLRMSLQTMLPRLAPPIGACARALPRNESPSMPPLASAEPPVTLQSEPPPLCSPLSRCGGRRCRGPRARAPRPPRRAARRRAGPR